MNAPNLSLQKTPSRGRSAGSGEAYVWVTSVGLALGIIMIAGLLGLIVINGIKVFWPKPVAVLTLKEEGATSFQGGKKLAGEILRSQPRIVTDPVEKQTLKDQGVTPKEWQVFVGNKDAYGQNFVFIDQNLVSGKEYPKEYIQIERLEYGDAIGIPQLLKLPDGSTVGSNDPSFRQKLESLCAEFNARRREITDIEKNQIGEINFSISELQLRRNALEREGKATPEALAKLETSRTKLEADYQVLAAKAKQLRDVQKSASLVYQLITGDTKELPLGSMVSFYYPNQLSLASSLGIFFHNIGSFLSEEPREANTEGGVFPAIFGTFTMTLLMSIAVTPFGVLAAIYLREYAKQGIFVRSVRIAVNNLAGVPSIVFGVFGLGFFVYGVGSFIDGGPHHPFSIVTWWSFVLVTTLSLAGAIAVPLMFGSKKPGIAPAPWVGTTSTLLGVATLLLAGVTLFFNPYFGGFYRDALPTPTFGTGGILWASLTLALMTVPVVIVATEEALAAVPRGMREGSLACGASKWQTIQRIILPSAVPGMLTGLILAMARGAGEVAPLMLVGVVKLAPSLPIDGTFPFFHLERKFMHLGFHIYDLGFQSPDSEAAKPMVFATTFLLIMLVVVMNLGAILIRERIRRKYQTGAF